MRRDEKLKNFWLNNNKKIIIIIADGSGRYFYYINEHTTSTRSLLCIVVVLLNERWGHRPWRRPWVSSQDPYAHYNICSKIKVFVHHEWRSSALRNRPAADRFWRNRRSARDVIISHYCYCYVRVIRHSWGFFLPSLTSKTTYSIFSPLTKVNSLFLCELTH